MHRSASTTRASDEYAAGATPGPRSSSSSSAAEEDRLPTYDPQSEAGKKAAQRARFAENMVHAIPLVLILCAVLLWLFSNPEIDISSKDDSILARIKNMTIDSYSNFTGSSEISGLEFGSVDEVEVKDTVRVTEEPE